MKRKILFLISFILSVSLSIAYGWGIVGMSGGPGVDWDLLNEDCADFSNPTWTNGDTGGAISEISPAGQFRFDTNSGAAGNDNAHRYCDFGSTPNTFTYRIRTYFDEIGTFANIDYFDTKVNQVDEYFLGLFASDGLYVYDTDSGYVEVGTNLVKESGNAETQIWYFLITFTGITGDGTCDIYLKDSTHNNEKVGTAINCSAEGAGTDGLVRLTQYGNTTDDMVTHIYSIQIATGLHIP